MISLFIFYFYFQCSCIPLFFLIIVLCFTAYVNFYVVCAPYSSPFDNKVGILLMVFVFNIITFLVFAIDKCCSLDEQKFQLQSYHRRRDETRIRVPELVLLFLTWAGSPLGAVLGVFCCDHKHSKREFMESFLLAVVFNWLWIYMLLIISADGITHLQSLCKESVLH